MNNFNDFKMSNLDDFKVEELEQRLEMRRLRWYPIASVSGGCTGSDCNIRVTAGAGFLF